ncbi:MAG: hypothetical protein SF123_12820 [Chloroflexota bacterium]|nr:hypothetical protein [Chloroflexota bacterium]
MSDQDVLMRSNAGMRLIALATIYNKGDFTRLRAYMKEHFTPSALETAPIALRLAELREQFRTTGKVRVRQVVTHDKHRVVAILSGEHGGNFIEDIAVEEEYPHKVSAHSRQQLL